MTITNQYGWSASNLLSNYKTTKLKFIVHLIIPIIHPVTNSIIYSESCSLEGCLPE